MAVKMLRFHQEAREKVCAGLNILASAVKITLGPKGRLVMLGRPYGPPTVINSGVIVAKEIELKIHSRISARRWRARLHRKPPRRPGTAPRQRRCSRRRW